MILSFISRFGATLIESRLKPKLKEESKTFIIDKIDQLEKLEHDDVDTLTTMIQGLHGKLQNGSEKLYSCTKCGNPTIYEDNFCSKCGVQQKHE
jgi:rubrerythrin